jgi:Family of unknown function (DUF6644)
VSLHNLFAWMADTPWSVELHESLWAYPIIESVHVLFLCLFLGLALMFDLRLTGLSLRNMPVSQVYRRLMPWTQVGFAVMVLSGLLLFYGIPLRTYENIFFRIKAVLLVLAGLNALVFHKVAYSTVAAWDNDPVPPVRVRMAGYASMVFWACIVVAGRLIAYNWFDKTQNPSG